MKGQVSFRLTVISQMALSMDAETEIESTIKGVLAFGDKLQPQSVEDYKKDIDALARIYLLKAEQVDELKDLVTDHFS